MKQDSASGLIMRIAGSTATGAGTILRSHPNQLDGEEHRRCGLDPHSESAGEDINANSIKIECLADQKHVGHHRRSIESQPIPLSQIEGRSNPFQGNCGLGL